MVYWWCRFHETDSRGWIILSPSVTCKKQRVNGLHPWNVWRIRSLSIFVSFLKQILQQHCQYWPEPARLIGQRWIIQPIRRASILTSNCSGTKSANQKTIIQSGYTVNSYFPGAASLIYSLQITHYHTISQPGNSVRRSACFYFAGIMSMFQPTVQSTCNKINLSTCRRSMVCLYGFWFLAYNVKCGFIGLVCLECSAALC